jgi:phosphonate transport system ATP-binding protein
LSPGDAREPLLEISGLTKTYPDGTRALAELDLVVPRGEFLVLVGRSGAGKSSLLRCVNRLVEPNQGTLRMGGIDVRALRGRALRALRRRIGMIFQEFHLVRRKRVLDNVLHGRLGHHQGLRGTLGWFPFEEKRRALEILIRLGLEDQALKRADQLSGGQKQRVAIGRALAQEPDLILADEPVASLDPASSEAVLGHLHRICKEEGITAMVSLHQVEYAREFADRIIGLRAGRLVFEGRPADLDDSAVRQLYFDDAAGDEQRAA